MVRRESTGLSYTAKMWRFILLIGMFMGSGAKVSGQTAKSDPQIDAAEALVGRALFLRGFPAGDDLSYNADGRLLGAEKPVCWTLAGMDVQKASRQGAEVQIEGVRVSIRFNPDSRQFERHSQNGESIKLRVADAGNERGFLAALDAIFAHGIDPRLQRETPAFWRHYFDSGLAWPADGLSVLDSGSAAAKEVTPPTVTHKADARVANGYAERDKVRGTVQMRLVVDTEGVPRRIALARPLGYGQDERAVESVAKWRFTPALRDGKPVALSLVVNYDFQ